MSAADVLTNTLRAIELRVTQRKTRELPTSDAKTGTETDQEISILTDPQTGQVTYKFR